MKVYILTYDIDRYDVLETDIIGVFTSEEKAKEEIEENLKEWSCRREDNYNIEEWNLI